MSKNNILNVNGQTLPKSKPIQGFTQIANAAILDQRLSFKARGILTLLLSRPSDWQIYVKELTNRSDKDGLRAVQTGLKELSALGYIELIPVYNNELGRFEGTFYRIKEHLFLSRPTHFRTDRDADGPVGRKAGKQATLNAVLPKSASLSNTESSNKENSKTKQQQQEEFTTAEEKNIEEFIPQLLKDQGWRHHFLQQSIGDGYILDDPKFDILLLHFQQTSLQQSRKYKTLEASKRHFANWFNTNLNQNKLLGFIQAARTRRKQAKGRLESALLKAGTIFQLFESRSCRDPHQVLKLREQLFIYRKRLSSLLPYLSLESRQVAAKNAVDNIDLLVAQIERGRLAEQLGWYCAHNSQCGFL